MATIKITKLGLQFIAHCKVADAISVTFKQICCFFFFRYISQEEGL